jgi:SagB-type dehydrogenase family enzyme
MVSLAKTVKLPPPRLKSSTSIEAVLQKRRSVRDYTNVQLSLSEISQLLWSAQGITNQEGYRTAPSAGALFPLEIYLLVNNVENLQTGVYKFNPINHELKLWFEGNIKTELCNSALGQDSITQSAASIIITAVFERVTSKYGKRGITYVHMEAGHAA